MSWSYIISIGVLLLSSASAQNSQADSSESRPPNIILIMADDLGYETLGANGSQEYQTPHLDHLAAEGMRFTHCHSTPLCTPSRVQIMTGKYNFRNYVGFGILDPEEKTFGHYLKSAGYQNLVVGKWQLYGNAHQQKLAGGRTGSLPQDAGFDDYMLWQIKDRGYRYKSPTLESKTEGLKTYPGEYGPDLFVDYIEAFMESNRDQPFFVYYPMVLTHDPFLPTPDHPEFNAYDPAAKVNNPRYFDGAVRYMDKLVGRMKTKVNELGVAENTLIIFIGDNGTDRDVTSMFEGNVWHGNKGYTTDAGTHVPMIAWWPGTIAKESVNKNLIDFTDFLPSLLEVAGEDVPKGRNLDGVSFYDQLMGGSDAGMTREWIFCDYNPQWGKFEPRRYVFDTTWKLYENGEIFNLSNDILEKNPMARSDLPEGARKKIEKFEMVLTNMK